MTQTIESLVEKLESVLGKKSDLRQQRDRLLDKKGAVLAGRERDERALSDSIRVLDSESRKILQEWEMSIPAKAADKVPATPPNRPIFAVDLDVNCTLIRDVFSVESFKKTGHINVPQGQVFVFGHESFDDGGFPEVYLGGETILSSNKDNKSLIAALAVVPGHIACLTNQWLPGISVSKEDAARVSIKIPLRLHDPHRTLNRTGGSWMTADGRKNVNGDIKEELEHQFNELLSERIQLWSADKPFLLSRIHKAVDQDLESWGLRTLPDSISVVRQYPKNLYVIVAEFGRAEQYILDLMNEQDAGQAQRRQLMEDLGFQRDDMLFIQSTAKQNSGIRGKGLFLKFRDNIPGWGGKVELRDRAMRWLGINGGASAVTYLSEIIKIYDTAEKADHKPDRDPSITDIKLSEQVLLSAFQNPMIALGEWIEEVL
jgi:hypothetical protein